MTAAEIYARSGLSPAEHAILTGDLWEAWRRVQAARRVLRGRAEAAGAVARLSAARLEIDCARQALGCLYVNAPEDPPAPRCCQLDCVVREAEAEETMP